MTIAIVVTSINAPNAALRALAEGAGLHGFEFVICGDTKSPSDFHLEGSTYLSVADQLKTDLSFAQLCPVRTYARKNIGYLMAIRNGARMIVETDDDNLPRPDFFHARNRRHEVACVEGHGWLNVYRYFSEANIWPRGLPLNMIQGAVPEFAGLAVREVDCPIQQGLADENPDVDAIYRLVLTLPQKFRTDRRVALGEGAWCPFNSQNTTWWADAFPLLYLPVHCSFRMTDIWRGFVAQRIAWSNNWHILFHEPTMWQERNEHDLMRDFADEIPGYLHNDRIRRALEDTSLEGGVENLAADLRRCYRTLISLQVVGPGEEALLDAWIADLARVRETVRA